MWRHFAGRDFPLEGFCKRLFPEEGFVRGGILPQSQMKGGGCQKISVLVNAQGIKK